MCIIFAVLILKIPIQNKYFLKKKKKLRVLQVGHLRFNGNGFCDLTFSITTGLTQGGSEKGAYLCWFVSTNAVGSNQSKTVDMSRDLRRESGLWARIEGRLTARPALRQDPKATYQRFAMSLEPI